MKYRLYENSNNDITNVVPEVLRNREIYDYNTYLHLTDLVTIDYNNLDNIHNAVNLFLKHYENNNIIYILVDEDPDGFCSSAMMYSYIKRLNKDYPVHYIMHTRTKAHGLDDIEIPNDAQLLIIPDASTNDVVDCKAIKERGIDILILDHHEKEVENPYALIVNNQMSKSYSNKNLCGAGIVYKFLQALDNETWNEYADDFLDLCALANISDSMDMRSFETRYLVGLGLSDIKNKFLKAMIKAQEYSMEDKINIHNVQWFITPVLNGMIRIGKKEEKELLFRAFIEQDEFFEYKKRKTKNTPEMTIQESIYDRAARLSKNAKSRHDKIRDKGIKAVTEIVKHSDNDNNKIIMIDIGDKIDKGLTGVIAIKIAERFNKPCILLKKRYNKKIDTMVYGGSARNMDNSPIESLKDVVNETGVITGQGHSNAFGIVDLKVEDFDKAFEVLNNMLKDVEYDSTYNVDFIVDVEEVEPEFIAEFSCFENLVGQGIKNPMIAVENVKLNKSCFEIYGKKEDIISFVYNDVKYVQFKCTEGNKLYDFLQNAWDDEDFIEFNLVGRPTVNDHNGVRTPQVIIEDVNVLAISNDSNEDNDEAW